MSYATLNDPATTDERGFVAAKIACKLCNMGFVTSKKWTSAYMTILDGIVKIYDSKESCEANPINPVMQIVLGSRHQASEVKKKNYSQDNLKIIEFFCFYVQTDNGMFGPTRLLKIGSPDPGTIERLVKCIDIHTQA